MRNNDSTVSHSSMRPKVSATDVIRNDDIHVNQLLLGRNNLGAMWNEDKTEPR